MNNDNKIIEIGFLEDYLYGDNVLPPTIVIEPGSDNLNTASIGLSNKYKTICNYKIHFIKRVTHGKIVEDVLDEKEKLLEIFKKNEIKEKIVSQNFNINLLNVRNNYNYWGFTILVNCELN
ncbi:MAG: hypothetical protein ACRC6K_00105 [Fusobacteriaceae bacterium]